MNGILPFKDGFGIIGGTALLTAAYSFGTDVVWDFTLGKAVDEVEELIAKEANTKHAIGVGSGTDALFLSMKILGIKEGDEIITTTYTFYATIGAIVTAGARPVFCDINEDFNLDINEIEDKITSKTKAIVPVHWAGRPCEMDEINKLAKK